MSLGLNNQLRHGAGFARKSSFVSFNRGTFILCFLFVLALGIVIRLFIIQIIEGPKYKKLAASMHGLVQELTPRRGEIYLQSASGGETLLRPIATSRNFFDVYAVPATIQSETSTSGLAVTTPEIAAQKLADLLNLDYETLKARFSKVGDPYEPVCEKIDEDQSKKVSALKLNGIGLTANPMRYYPDKNLFSHITGFIGVDKYDEKTGLYGLEQYFNDTLKGENGYLATEKDIVGNPISISGLNKKDSVDGANLILTLDYQIQYTACSELKKAVEKYGAISGNIIVMNPKTGALIALCNYPDFDPNNYSLTKDPATFIDHAISDSYEPGSIFKPIVMSYAIDRGIVTPETTYEDTGEVEIGKYTIKNSDLKGHGTQTMLGVLEKSLNTGMVFVARQMGHDLFKKALEDYGFGEALGIELPAEGHGDISSISKKGDIYYATASFGQGITVTPIQMVSAFGALANQGKIMKPYLVDKIIYNENRQTQTEPKVLRQVISPSAAAAVSGMLVSVVDNGYGNKASVKGYYIAGKTGTAQVAGEGGYSDKTIQSFIGFGPIKDPRFVMLVKLDEPANSTFAESSCAPTFQKIAQFMLDYYQIPPER